MDDNKQMRNRKKKVDEVERLTQENRELKRINRSLMRQLKKSRHPIEKIMDDVEDSIDDRENCNKCQECGKGYIVTIEMGPRKQKGCNTCGWRGKIVKK